MIFNMYTRRTSVTFVNLSALLALISMGLALWVVHITVKNIFTNSVVGKFASTWGIAMTHGVVLILAFGSLTYAFLAIREPRNHFRNHLYDLSVRTASRYGMATICLNPAVLLVLCRWFIH